MAVMNILANRINDQKDPRLSLDYANLLGGDCLVRPCRSGVVYQLHCRATKRGTIGGQVAAKNATA